MSVALTFEHVGKRFGDTVVLADVHFKTEPGELVVLVGPSGCGKSTLMRVVAGLETISEGRILAGDRVLNDVAPADRGVGMVFQSYALYPHLTVRENLAFPLFVKKTPAAETEREVLRVAEMLSLKPLLDRLPKQLSGGQRQRVAIGRCLVRKPEIYCFDEPLSNLDAGLRSQIRVELKSLQRELGKTAIYVTHDQVEAMTMADRIVVLHKGVVQQVGRPDELYMQPKNTFVARFIGSPAMTLLRGEVADGVFHSGSLSLTLDATPGPCIVGVRPEHVVLSESGACSGLVRAVEPIGETGYVHLAVSGLALETASSDTPRGALLTASLPGKKAFELREGGTLRFDVASEGVSVFDPTSGEARPRRASQETDAA